MGCKHSLNAYRQHVQYQNLLTKTPSSTRKKPLLMFLIAPVLMLLWHGEICLLTEMIISVVFICQCFPNCAMLNLSFVRYSSA